jgi:hypothetical protein
MYRPRDRRKIAAAPAYHSLRTGAYVRQVGTCSRWPAPYPDRRIQRLGSRHGRGAGAVTPEVAARRPAAIAWLWSWALLGALCSLPAALVALRSPSDGLALALGCIPAAAVGARGGRRSRVAVLVVGLCIGLGLVLGAALSTFWLLAVGGIFVLALGAAVVSAHARVGSLLMTLAVPMVGAGLSFDGDVEAAAGVAALMAVGAVYGWLLCLCWPEEPVSAPAPIQRCPVKPRWWSTACGSGWPAQSAPPWDSPSTWVTRGGRRRHASWSCVPRKR